MLSILRRQTTTKDLLRYIWRLSLVVVSMGVVVFVSPPSRTLLGGLASVIGLLAAGILVIFLVSYLVARLSGVDKAFGRLETDGRMADADDAEEYWANMKQPRFNFAYRWPAPHPAVIPTTRRTGRDEAPKPIHRAWIIAKAVITIAIVFGLLYVILRDVT